MKSHSDDSGRIAALEAEITRLRAELEEARASEAGAHMIIATERAEVAQLRRRVAELEAQGLPRDRLPWTWRLWVNGSTCATDGRAKTELAAKNALLAAWRDFIARLGLMERIEG